MSEPIVFKYGITKLFRTAKCVNVRKGDFLDLAAAPSDAAPVEGSDTLVRCPEVMLVTAGAFDMAVPELGTIQLQAGDIGSSERFRGPIRIGAATDNSGYVCVTPRDGSFWHREAGFVGAGETMLVEVPPCDNAYLYVATGGLADGGEIGVFVPMEPGEHDITGEFATRFLLLWR